MPFPGHYRPSESGGTHVLREETEADAPVADVVPSKQYMEKETENNQRVEDKQFEDIYGKEQDNH